MSVSKKQAGTGKGGRAVPAGRAKFAERSAHKGVAPTLRRLAGHFEDTGEAAQAVAEFRALLAVARAADRWADTSVAAEEFMEIENALVRALARLSRLSGGRP